MFAYCWLIVLHNANVLRLLASLNIHIFIPDRLAQTTISSMIALDGIPKLKVMHSPYPSQALPHGDINCSREPDAESKLLKSGKFYGIGRKDNHDGQFVLGWWITGICPDDVRIACHPTFVRVDDGYRRARGFGRPELQRVIYFGPGGSLMV